MGVYVCVYFCVVVGGGGGVETRGRGGGECPPIRKCNFDFEVSSKVTRSSDLHKYVLRSTVLNVLNMGQIGWLVL